MSNHHQKEVVYTFPFCFLLIEYVFGMYLNNVFLYTPLYPYTTSTDEILALVLLFWGFKYTLIRKKEFFDKGTRRFFALILFYLLYSFYIRSNIPVAILSDLLVSVKPFIGYFIFIYIAFTLNLSQKKILKRVSVFLFILTAIVGVIGAMSGNPFYMQTYIYGHPTYYGSALVLIGLTYLFCSDINKNKDVFIFIFILAFSLLSGRSKLYGFFAFSVLVMYILRGNIEIKLSVKNIILFSLAIVIVLYVSWGKVSFYFFNDIDSDLVARTMMYSTSIDLLIDYFPFGSGFASFATHYSGVYYSHIYTDYGLDNVWGLEEESANFAGDAYYPSLAQFGVFGVILFFMFFAKILIKANKLKKLSDNNTQYLIIVFILTFLLIQSVAETMLTSNRGFYIMILLSLSINESFSKATAINHNPEKRNALS